MTNKNFTPGPWCYEAKNGFSGDWRLRFVIFSNPECTIESRIATISLRGSPKQDADVSEANAKLISSAPELLDACKEALTILLYNGYTNGIITQLQSAIDKATYVEEIPEPALEDDPEKLGLTDKTFGDQ